VSAKQRSVVHETTTHPITNREAKRATIRAMKKAAKRGNDNARRVLEKLGAKP
jgi:hypothetical protein